MTAAKRHTPGLVAPQVNKVAVSIPASYGLLERL
ncbi:hypothetical protein SME46J_47660 (plasmid) [Serratia marcescens]|nr:hypothetical protein SME46J_47660 [Serratia marcescens]